MVSLARLTDWLVSVINPLGWLRPKEKLVAQLANLPGATFEDRLPEFFDKYQAAFASCDPAQFDAVASQLFAALAEQAEQDPSPEDILTALAGQCNALADWVGAEAAYKRMLALPDRLPAYESQVHWQLATLYARVLNRQPEALDHLQKATQAARRADIDILIVMALKNEAWFLLGANRLVEARQRIDEAMTYVTTEAFFRQAHASILILRAECQRLSGLATEAQQDLAQAYEFLKPFASAEMAAGIQSDLADLWAGTARLRQGQNDYDGAILAWQEAVRLTKLIAASPHAGSIHAQMNVAEMLESLANAAVRQREQLLADIRLPAAVPS